MPDAGERQPRSQAETNAHKCHYYPSLVDQRGIIFQHPQYNWWREKVILYHISIELYHSFSISIRWWRCHFRPCRSTNQTDRPWSWCCVRRQSCCQNGGWALEDFWNRPPSLYSYHWILLCFNRIWGCFGCCVTRGILALEPLFYDSPTISAISTPLPRQKVLAWSLQGHRPIYHVRRFHQNWLALHPRFLWRCQLLRTKHLGQICTNNVLFLMILLVIIFQKQNSFNGDRGSFPIVLCSSHRSRLENDISQLEEYLWLLPHGHPSTLLFIFQHLSIQVDHLIFHIAISEDLIHLAPWKQIKNMMDTQEDMIFQVALIL